MNAGTRAALALLFAAAAWPASALAQTVEEFYRSKSITMLVGGGAGGGYDTYARIFARHLSRHIPGNPRTRWFGVRRNSSQKASGGPGNRQSIGDTDGDITAISRSECVT